ncbi:uncharacterized protein LOC125189601 [Salvia hispanica]|uniref:uncharacterized protein LOC125189601 n=1 Tax=Salvia hispanica TaxID=49212 RepID=UPI002009A00A|nr:uncharacterized protein LOC125189601 [Salvia hispanica]
MVDQIIRPLQREVANLITCYKHNLEEAVNIRSHREASISTSDLYDAGLATSFMKKQVYPSKNLKVRQTHHEQQQTKRIPKPFSTTKIDKPFDICSPQTSEDLVEESAVVLGPGMILLKCYIPLLEQLNIINKCRELGCGPGGFYQPGYNDGAKLHCYMMCLGLGWNPQTASYGERRCHDNAAPPLLPNEFISLVCRALDHSHTLIERNLKVDNINDTLPKMSPDVCIVNFYPCNGWLGFHQDRYETQESLDKRLPVVSISIGASAEFLYGEERDVNKAKSVLLESGDVLIFGGESRHIYHGVKAILPDTAPLVLLERTGLKPGL